jgi:hypothetical protein
MTRLTTLLALLLTGCCSIAQVDMQRQIELEKSTVKEVTK